jgi:hypothetical protein
MVSLDHQKLPLPPSSVRVNNLNLNRYGTNPSIPTCLTFAEKTMKNSEIEYKTVHGNYIAPITR